jgi:hypothetical protein
VIRSNSAQRSSLVKLTCSKRCFDTDSDLYPNGFQTKHDAQLKKTFSIGANCSSIRRCHSKRIGGPWVYFEWGTVTIEVAPDATQAYVQGDRTLRTIRCRHCGCVTHWEPISAEAGARHGVHLGNFDPKLIASVRVRRLDGANTWRFRMSEASIPRLFRYCCGNRRDAACAPLAHERIVQSYLVHLTTSRRLFSRAKE